jgi:lipid II:glycine glycyltransferase (peptidoglycan interpeptide bridge formation enzyme)
MYALFQNTDRFNPLVLATYENGDLCGILMGVFIHERNGPVKLFSSRFVIYGGPLLSGDDTTKNKSLELLLRSLIKETRSKALFIQFRNFFPQNKFIRVYNKFGFHLLDRLNYIIHISDREKVFKNMSESRRRQVGKALRNGAKIIEPNSIEQVKAFYDILYHLYRYKIRKPLPDWSFFENFYALTSESRDTETLKSSNKPSNRSIGIIRLIEYNNRIIGGILAPVFNDHSIYEWYVCGLDKEYKKQYPSVLATWAGIEYAIENNIRYFDFMGVGKPDQEYGVRNFKARFGGELVNHGRITRINNRVLYSIAELGYNLLAVFKRI